MNKETEELGKKLHDVLSIQVAAKKTGVDYSSGKGVTIYEIRPYDKGYMKLEILKVCKEEGLKFVDKYNYTGREIGV